MKTISITPPNSLILIMDYTSGQVPETMGNELVSATRSCIAVGCRSEDDGPTEVHLAESHEVTPSEALRFDGEISTPSKKLSICSVLNQEILSTHVHGTTTRVRVFANHAMEPDRILIVVD
jgi:hypothetical protein